MKSRLSSGELLQDFSWPGVAWWALQQTFRARIPANSLIENTPFASARLTARFYAGIEALKVCWSAHQATPGQEKSWRSSPLLSRDFNPKSECPPQTPPLPPSGRILADRGDLRGEVCRVMPRHAAVLATNWQREGDT